MYKAYAELNKIRSVEFNSLRSLMKYIGDRIPRLLHQYGFPNNTVIDILPAYPRDLTKLHMPSIIVRKVDSSQEKLSMNGFIGQYYHKEDNALVDVKAIKHNLSVQFDILASGNKQCMAIESMIVEDILTYTLMWKKGYIPFYDFIYYDQYDPHADENLEEVGTLCMVKTPKEVNLSSWRISVNEPTINEHALLVRQDFQIVQTIVPRQEFVDLSLWIKQHIKLSIKEE